MPKLENSILGTPKMFLAQSALPSCLVGFLCAPVWHVVLVISTRISSRMDRIRDMLKQSQSKDGRIADTMKMLRLVNRHWSSWATKAIEMVRPPDVPWGMLLEVVIEKFVNLRSLKLDRIIMIDDEDLANLCKLSSLTCVDFSRVCLNYIRNITDMDLKSLGNLRRLKDLKLEVCEWITDVGIKLLGSLTSLTTLFLSRCSETTDEGMPYVERLGALRNLDVIYCRKQQVLGWVICHCWLLWQDSIFIGALKSLLKMSLVWGILWMKWQTKIQVI